MFCVLSEKVLLLILQLDQVLLVLGICLGFDAVDSTVKLASFGRFQRDLVLLHQLSHWVEAGVDMRFPWCMHDGWQSHELLWRVFVNIAELKRGWLFSTLSRNIHHSLTKISTLAHFVPTWSILFLELLTDLKRQCFVYKLLPHLFVLVVFDVVVNVLPRSLITCIIWLCEYALLYFPDSVVCAIGTVNVLNTWLILQTRQIG